MEFPASLRRKNDSELSGGSDGEWNPKNSVILSIRVARQGVFGVSVSGKALNNRFHWDHPGVVWVCLGLCFQTSDFKGQLQT